MINGDSIEAIIKPFWIVIPRYEGQEVKKYSRPHRKIKKHKLFSLDEQDNNKILKKSICNIKQKNRIQQCSTSVVNTSGYTSLVEVGSDIVMANITKNDKTVKNKDASCITTCIDKPDSISKQRTIKNIKKELECTKRSKKVIDKYKHSIEIHKTSRMNMKKKSCTAKDDEYKNVYGKSGPDCVVDKIIQNMKVMSKNGKLTADIDKSKNCNIECRSKVLKQDIINGNVSVKDVIAPINKQCSTEYDKSSIIRSNANKEYITKDLTSQNCAQPPTLSNTTHINKKQKYKFEEINIFSDSDISAPTIKKRKYKNRPNNPSSVNPRSISKIYASPSSNKIREDKNIDQLNKKLKIPDETVKNSNEDNLVQSSCDTLDKEKQNIKKKCKDTSEAAKKSILRKDKKKHNISYSSSVENNTLLDKNITHNGYMERGNESGRNNCADYKDSTTHSIKECNHNINEDSKKKASNVKDNITLDKENYNTKNKDLLDESSKCRVRKYNHIDEDCKKKPGVNKNNIVLDNVSNIKNLDKNANKHVPKELNHSINEEYMEPNDIKCTITDTSVKPEDSLYKSFSNYATKKNDTDKGKKKHSNIENNIMSEKTTSAKTNNLLGEAIELIINSSDEDSKNIIERSNDKSINPSSTKGCNEAIEPIINNSDEDGENIISDRSNYINHKESDINKNLITPNEVVNNNNIKQVPKALNFDIYDNCMMEPNNITNSIMINTSITEYTTEKDNIDRDRKKYVNADNNIPYEAGGIDINVTNLTEDCNHNIDEDGKQKTNDVDNGIIRSEYEVREQINISKDSKKKSNNSKKSSIRYDNNAKNILYKSSTKYASNDLSCYINKHYYKEKPKNTENSKLEKCNSVESNNLVEKCGISKHNNFVDKNEDIPDTNNDNNIRNKRITEYNTKTLCDFIYKESNMSHSIEKNDLVGSIENNLSSDGSSIIKKADNSLTFISKTGTDTNMSNEEYVIEQGKSMNSENSLANDSIDKVCDITKKIKDCLSTDLDIFPLEDIIANDRSSNLDHSRSFIENANLSGNNHIGNNDNTNHDEDDDDVIYMDTVLPINEGVDIGNEKPNHTVYNKVTIVNDKKKNKLEQQDSQTKFTNNAKDPSKFIDTNISNSITITNINLSSKLEVNNKRNVKNSVNVNKTDITVVDNVYPNKPLPTKVNIFTNKKSITTKENTAITRSLAKKLCERYLEHDRLISSIAYNFIQILQMDNNVCNMNKTAEMLEIDLRNKLKLIEEDILEKHMLHISFYTLVLMIYYKMRKLNYKVTLLYLKNQMIRYFLSNNQILDILKSQMFDKLCLKLYSTVKSIYRHKKTGTNYKREPTNTCLMQNTSNEFQLQSKENATSYSLLQSNGLENTKKLDIQLKECSYNEINSKNDNLNNLSTEKHTNGTTKSNNNKATVIMEQSFLVDDQKVIISIPSTNMVPSLYDTPNEEISSKVQLSDKSADENNIEDTTPSSYNIPHEEISRVELSDISENKNNKGIIDLDQQKFQQKTLKKLGQLRQITMFPVTKLNIIQNKDLLPDTESLKDLPKACLSSNNDTLEIEHLQEESLPILSIDLTKSPQQYDNQQNTSLPEFDLEWTNSLLYVPGKIKDLMMSKDISPVTCSVNKKEHSEIGDLQLTSSTITNTCEKEQSVTTSTQEKIITSTHEEQQSVIFNTHKEQQSVITNTNKEQQFRVTQEEQPPPKCLEKVQPPNSCNGFLRLKSPQQLYEKEAYEKMVQEKNMHNLEQQTIYNIKGKQSQQQQEVIQTLKNYCDIQPQKQHQQIQSPEFQNIIHHAQLGQSVRNKHRGRPRRIGPKQQIVRQHQQKSQQNQQWKLIGLQNLSKPECRHLISKLGSALHQVVTHYNETVNQNTASQNISPVQSPSVTSTDQIFPTEYSPTQNVVDNQVNSINPHLPLYMLNTTEKSSVLSQQLHCSHPPPPRYQSPSLPSEIVAREYSSSSEQLYQQQQQHFITHQSPYNPHNINNNSNIQGTYPSTLPSYIPQQQAIQCTKSYKNAYNVENVPQQNSMTTEAYNIYGSTPLTNSGLACTTLQSDAITQQSMGQICPINKTIAGIAHAEMRMQYPNTISQYQLQQKEGQIVNKQHYYPTVTGVSSKQLGPHAIPEESSLTASQALPNTSMSNVIPRYSHYASVGNISNLPNQLTSPNNNGWMENRNPDFFNTLYQNPQQFPKCYAVGCNEASISRCGKCRRVYYCSSTCQEADWNSVHRNQCGNY